MIKKVFKYIKLLGMMIKIIVKTTWVHILRQLEKNKQKRISKRAFREEDKEDSLSMRKYITILIGILIIDLLIKDNMLFKLNNENSKLKEQLQYQSQQITSIQESLTTQEESNALISSSISQVTEDIDSVNSTLNEIKENSIGINIEDNSDEANSGISDDE